MEYTSDGWTISPSQEGDPDPYPMRLSDGYATVTVKNSNGNFSADMATAYQDQNLSDNETTFRVYTPYNAPTNETSFRLVNSSNLGIAQSIIQSGIAPTPLFKIKNVNSGLYLQAQAASGSSLVQEPYPTSASSQPQFQWGFIKVGTNLYRIFSVYYGAMVDAKNNTNPPNNGTKVQTFSWKTSSTGNQQWYWDPSQQTFASSYSSSMVWMISGSSTSSGASVVLEPYSSGSSSQQWELEFVE